MRWLQQDCKTARRVSVAAQASGQHSFHKKTHAVAIRAEQRFRNVSTRGSCAGTWKKVGTKRSTKDIVSGGVTATGYRVNAYGRRVWASQ